jgi:hypothetical protein
MLYKTLLFLVISNAAQSQDFYNFRHNGAGIEWNQVYEYQGDINHIRSKIMNTTVFSSIYALNDSTLTGQSILIRAKYDGTESRHTGLSQTIYSKGGMSGTVRIEIRENKYRVTLYNISIDPKEGIQDKADPEPLEALYWSPKHNNFRQNWLRDDLIGFDHALRDAFVIKSNEW